MLRTEHLFTLPCGYIDAQGTLHRQGVMRMATAQDEVEPLQDARVRANSAYLGILLLSRVLTRLGEISPVSVETVAGLFAADFVYLQELYLQINRSNGSIVETRCPACGTRFALDLAQREEGIPTDGNV
jgi:hypothetical protein